MGNGAILVSVVPHNTLTAPPQWSHGGELPSPSSFQGSWIPATSLVMQVESRWPPSSDGGCWGSRRPRRASSRSTRARPTAPSSRPGVRGLRQPRDDVEARVRPGGARAAWTCDGQRRARRARRTRLALVLRAERAGRHTVRAVQLVGTGPSPRLPLRAAAVGGQTGRILGRDQERASQPRLPITGHDPGRGLAEGPHLRHRGRHARSCNACSASARPKTPYCSARSLNYIRTFKAAATVVDTSPPGVTITQDNAFTRGEWVRGTQQVRLCGAGQCGGTGGSGGVAGARRAGEHSRRATTPYASRARTAGRDLDRHDQPFGRGLAGAGTCRRRMRPPTSGVSVRSPFASTTRHRARFPSRSRAARAGATATTSTSPGRTRTRATARRSRPPLPPLPRGREARVHSESPGRARSTASRDLSRARTRRVAAARLARGRRRKSRARQRLGSGDAALRPGAAGSSGSRNLAAIRPDACLGARHRQGLGPRERPDRAQRGGLRSLAAAAHPAAGRAA